MATTMVHKGRISGFGKTLTCDSQIAAAESFFMNHNQIMPPTTVPCNHDVYPPAFEAAELQITHTYQAFKGFSTEKAGFSDPDSAWFEKANPTDAPWNIFLSQVSQYTSCGILHTKGLLFRASFLCVCDKGPQGLKALKAKQVTRKRAFNHSHS